MSHFTSITTKIVSAKHLVLALNDLGFAEVEVHATPQPLVGFEGDARANKAHVIIRKKHIGLLSNDIGFAQNAKGTFDALISDYDRNTYNHAWLQKLTQRYAYHVSCDMLAQQRFSLVEEKTEKNGTIRLTVRRMA
jgi:hypothetical protein